MKFYWNLDFISIYFIFYVLKYISIKISAKKFMKNRETTARHYNLLPNQGYAVRIAMKLYI